MEQGDGSNYRNQGGGHAWQRRLGIFDSLFWAQCLRCSAILIFQNDATLLENHYTIIKRERCQSPAWTKATPEEGRQTVLWMKSTALYDSKGIFIGVMGRIRDVTEEMGAELLTIPKQTAESSGAPLSSKSGMFDKILGKAQNQLQERHAALLLGREVY